MGVVACVRHAGRAPRREGSPRPGGGPPGQVDRFTSLDLALPPARSSMPASCPAPCRGWRTRCSRRPPAGSDVVLLGIPTRGVPLARRLAARIEAFEGLSLPTGQIDPDDVPGRSADARGPAARGDPPSCRRSRRQGRGPRRRRAVLRPHGTGGTRRAGRARPAAHRPAGGARRPRTPRAAHPRRLCRQEHPDFPRRRWCTSCSTRWTAGTRCSSGMPPPTAVPRRRPAPPRQREGLR